MSKFKRSTENNDVFAEFTCQGRSHSIFKRLVKGKRQQNWSLKFDHLGKTVFHSLGTPVKHIAIDIAKKKITAALKGHWDKLEESKLKRDAKPATIGEILAVYKEGIVGRAHMKNLATPVKNVSCLRGMVRTVLGESPALENRSANILTRDLVQGAMEKWAQEGRSVTTVNSLVTQARAVFSHQALELYADKELVLPDLEPFLGVRRLRNDRDVSFRPILPATLQAMQASTLEQDNGVRLVWLMAYELGMCASEIWAARKDWLEEWPDGWKMAIVNRPYFSTKGREGRVPVSQAVAEEIRQRWSSDTMWILPGNTPTDRENLVKRTANAWIRPFIPDREKGIHELRKQAGSEIATRDGLLAARDWLRHKSVKTTEAHYASLLTPLRPRFAHSEEHYTAAEVGH